MTYQKPLALCAVCAMALLSLLQLCGLAPSWIAFLLGVAMFFVWKIQERASFADCGLDFAPVGAYLSRRAVLLAFLAPIAVQIGLLLLAHAFFPAYSDAMALKNSLQFLSNGTILSALQIIIMAFGEELAWRGFFQRQLGALMPSRAALVLAALCYSLGHVNSGELSVMVYDFAIVLFSNLLYSYVYTKTGNLWLTTISHAAASLCSFLVLLML